MPSFRITHHLPLDEHHQPLLQILTHTLLQHRTGIPNYNRVHLLLSLMDLRIKMDYPRTTSNIELHTNWAIIVDEYLNTEWEELNEGEVDEDFFFAENRFFALAKLLVDGEWLPGFGKIAQTISDMVQEAVRTDIRRRREEENVQAAASDSSGMES